MTSNLGAAFLNELPDDGGPIPADTRELVNGAIRAHLPPEVSFSRKRARSQS